MISVDNRGTEIRFRIHCHEWKNAKVLSRTVRAELPDIVIAHSSLQLVRIDQESSASCYTSRRDRLEVLASQNFVVSPTPL